MRAFWLMLVFGVVGFLDSAYLTLEHIKGVIPGCALSGCETVLTSKYASIYGFPTAGLGLIYYGLMIFLLLMFLDRKVRMFAFLATRLSIVGLLCSFGFVFLQLIILGAVCQYCMASAAMCLLIFVVSIYKWELIFE